MANNAPDRSGAMTAAGLLAGLLIAITPLGPAHGSPTPFVDQSPVPPTAAAASCANSHWSSILLATTEDTFPGFTELPPCLPWTKGPCLAINGPCFADEAKGCGKESAACFANPNNKDCIKGMACLAKCGSDTTCSTGCFAAFGSDTFTGFLGCALEDKKCLSFPSDPKLLGWLDDGAEAPKKVANFDINSLKGDWFKVLGLDERYDCFECQQNRFRQDEDKGWRMDTSFRLPRFRGQTQVSVEPPLAPNTFKWPASSSQKPNANYYQNDLTEEVIVDAPDAKPSMHTTGKTFGLTFWENYYIVGQGEDFQFIRYVGHTLQGGYKGAFILSKSPQLSPDALVQVKKIAANQGLDLGGFCKIKNDACGVRNDPPTGGGDIQDVIGDANSYIKYMFGRQEKFSP